MTVYTLGPLPKWNVYIFCWMIPLIGYPSCVFQTYLWLLLCWYWWLGSLTFGGNFMSPIFERNLNHGCAEFQFSPIFSFTVLLQFNITATKLLCQSWIKLTGFPGMLRRKKSHFSLLFPSSQSCSGHYETRRGRPRW